MKYKYHTPVLLLSILLTSCADEDMALVGALATGAAAGYAQSNGNAAGAAGLLNTQQQILNEASHTAEVNADAISTTSRATSLQASGQADFPGSSASGITGTWSNSNATWTLSPGGKGKITIPSTNQNGTATTYINYTADSSGTFAYTITRATLEGSINCNGTYDYDKPVNKSYSETYSLNGNTLTIGTEVMTRD